MSLLQAIYVFSTHVSLNHMVQFINFHQVNWVFLNQN